MCRKWLSSLLSTTDTVLWLAYANHILFLPSCYICIFDRTVTSTRAVDVRNFSTRQTTSCESKSLAKYFSRSYIFQTSRRVFGSLCLFVYLCVYSYFSLSIDIVRHYPVVHCLLYWTMASKAPISGQQEKGEQQSMGSAKT